MKKLSKKNQSLLLLLVAAFLVLPLSPGEQKFQYSFAQGKPWQYGLLTAPYDFPILKSKEQLEQEREEVKQSILPFYRVNENVEKEVIAKWTEDYNAAYASSYPKDYYIYVRGFIRRVYTENGIVNEEERVAMEERNLDEINLLTGSESRSYPVALLYSIADAYEALLNNTPDELSRDIVKKLFPAEQLKVNVYPDQATTAKVTNEELKKIPNNIGIVLKDQRIIGRGEIVYGEQYSMLSSFKEAYESKTGLGSTILWRRVGLLLLSLLMFTSVWLFWYNFRPRFFENIKNSFFVASTMLFFILVTQLVMRLYPAAVYAIPFAVLPIIVRPFFHSRMAFFLHLVTVLISSLFVSDALEFFFLQLAAGMVAVYSLKTLNSRGQLVLTSFLVFLTYVVISLTLALNLKGAIEKEDFVKLLYYAFNLVFLMFSYMLIYPIEKVFGYVSNVSLVELSDINRPLLRQLSEIAPGTFQHSMQMSILAAEAATRIGADAQLIRTGALYHDIGKMLNPSYFTENQGDAGNPHSALSYKESAATIIKHVTDGYTIAQRHGLPKSVSDMILTHHGKGKVKYFYRLYCKEHPDEQVDPAPFTYPGPNPFTKEQGILMLADGVEAASRSLKIYTEETIRALVDSITNSVLEDKLLDNTPLTFQDITTIKEVFVDKLKTIYHSRIAYPKESEQEKREKAKKNLTEESLVLQEGKENTNEGSTAPQMQATEE